MQNPFEKLPAFISATAAIVVLITCIIAQATLHLMAVWVSVSIVLFYFIGEFVRFFVTTKIFPQQENFGDGFDFEIEAEYIDESGSEEVGDVEEHELEYQEEYPETSEDGAGRMGTLFDEEDDESEEDLEAASVSDSFLEGN